MPSCSTHTGVLGETLVNSRPASVFIQRSRHALCALPTHLDAGSCYLVACDDGILYQDRKLNYTCGNAGRDGKRGWFVGQFVAPEFGLRHRHDVEIKWGVHPRGESRPGAWVSYKVATSIVVLIRGEILIRVRGGGAEIEDVMLSAEGDYIIMPPIIEHTWEALTDCVVLTVRCPSLADDQRQVDD